MKLSLPIIVDRLSFPLLEKLPEGASSALNLPRPVFYTNEKKLKADTLYLCKGLELPRKLEFEEGCALICIGPPEKTEADRPLDNICILEKDVDIFRLSNEINHIYDLFEIWDENLNRISLSMASGEELAALLTKAIETGQINKDSLKSELKYLGLYEIKDFCFVHFQTGNRTALASDTAVFCRELSSDLENSFIFIYKASINVLLGANDDNFEDCYAIINRFAQKHDYKAGISNRFSDFEKLNLYYRQALIALKFGNMEKTDDRLYDFSTYTLDYAFRKIGEEFDADQLYSPVYKRLREYDSANGTDYLETLCAYLKNNRNAVQTAKDIFVHRATMIYRLKRIMEIGKTELKDERELLHLYMTLFMAGQLNVGLKEGKETDPEGDAEEGFRDSLEVMNEKIRAEESAADNTDIEEDTNYDYRSIS